MSFSTGVLVGAALALIAVALMFGLGMVAWRMLVDGWLGYSWRDDVKQIAERWTSRLARPTHCSKCGSLGWALCEHCNRREAK